MIVGLTGRSESGKDTVGSYLINVYGFVRFAFGDDVKEMLYRLNPTIFDLEETLPQPYSTGPWRLQTIVDHIGWEAAKQQPEIARLLQTLSSECVRDMVGQDSWIRVLERRIWPANGRTAGVIDVVITGVRFTNEADAIRRWGGQVWKLVRPGHVGKRDPNHISETEVDEIDVDRTILNDRGLIHLAETVDQAIRSMR